MDNDMPGGPNDEAIYISDHEVIYISSDEEPPLPGLSARTEADCDPTVPRNGEHPRVLVGRCTFVNEWECVDETALVYLWHTPACGVGVFAGEDIPEGAPVFIYGGKMVHLGRCSRAGLSADQGTHILSLAGTCGIDSRISPEEGLTWKYYVEEARNVAGFSNASRDANCFLTIHPKPDDVANYVLQRRGVDPDPGETQVIAYFRASQDIPKGTQLLWNYRCDPHPGAEGAEMVLVDPSPPMGGW